MIITYPAAVMDEKHAGRWYSYRCLACDVEGTYLA